MCRCVDGYTNHLILFLCIQKQQETLASQFICKFCLTGVSSPVPSTVFHALVQHLCDELHADLIQIGAFQQSDDGNDNSMVMVIHFGKRANLEGRFVQVQCRPSRVKDAMTSFTLAPTQQRPSSITLCLVDGPFEGEGAVQYVPPGTRNFSKHQWYRYITERSCY